MGVFFRIRVHPLKYIFPWKSFDVAAILGAFKNVENADAVKN